MPQQFGPEENPITVFSRAMAGGFNPSTLRALRETRLREMERNRDFQDDSRIEQAIGRHESASPASRQRDRMMGWDLGTPSFTTGATRSDVRNLAADLDEDPDTGLEAQARTRRIARTLDDAATTQRQEVGDAVDVTSRRNAFAEFLKNKGIVQGKAAGEISDEGAQALDAASQRRQAEAGVLAAGRRLSHGGVPIAALKPGDDPLEGLSAQERGIIQGLADYTIDLPGGAALRTPEWQDRLGRVKMLDPSFDQTQYATRKKMRGDATFQNNVQSLGTLREHADSLHTKGQALGNYGATPINAVRNWWKKLTGDPDLAGYGIDQTVVGDEAARALKGGVPTQAESEHWRSLLGADLSPGAQDEAHRTINELAEKRLGEAGQRYDSVMGKPGAFQAYLERTKGKAGQIATGGAPGAPQEGDTKPLDANGAEATFQGGRWIRTR